MSKLDIIVFGATGFTGKLVVDKLISLCKNHPYTDLSWGVAGRSEKKLQELVKHIEESGSHQKLPIIIAEATDAASLATMAAQARVLMNCTGPYTVLGEPVLRACVDGGTHYVDMTAELHFMLQMYEKYHSAAEAAGVVVVPACGFGSVPAALGMVHLEKQFKGTLSSVDCYTALDIPRRAYFPGCDNTLVHYGTWASLVHEFQNFREYTARKKAVFPDDVYEPEPEKSKKSFLHRHERRFWFPYPGPDRDIVDASERYLHEKRGKKPVRFNIYTTMPWFIHLVLLLPVFFFYYYASFCKWFRRLLWRFPGFFTLGYISHKGPSQRNMKEMKFSFVFTGTGAEAAKDGTEGKSLTVKISGDDPYGTTALTFVMAAITVVKEQSAMPKGGVLSSGAAFYDTQLIERLNSNGLRFEILDK